MAGLIITGMIIWILYLFFKKIGGKKSYKPQVKQQISASREGREFSLKHFGTDWKTYFSKYNPNTNFNSTFYTTIGQAYDSLSAAEKKNLFLSFAGSNKSYSSDKSTLTVSLNFKNYDALFLGTYDLINRKLFSKDSMIKLFTSLAENQISKREEYKKEDSILDVTGQSYKIDYTTAINDFNNSSYSYNPEEFRLGTKYKDKLNLSPQQVKVLNKFWNPHNVFLSIEGCCIQAIKIYLVVIQELEEKLKKQGTTLEKEVEAIRKLYLPGRSSNQSDDFHYNYWYERSESDIYLTIFKRVESLLREEYYHKRKVSGEFANAEVSKGFEEHIGNYVNEILPNLKNLIRSPDETTQIELNAQNVTRWKQEFEKLISTYSPVKKREFTEGVLKLGELNIKNPSIENLYFEASKFLAKYDKEESLKMYIHYLYKDLKSDKFDNKQLTKTIQKGIFKTTEELQDFEKIIGNLVREKDLEKALDEVPKIFAPKRKKISLDLKSIKEVEKQHSGTVDLLNEYLKDEFEDEVITVTSKETANEEVEIKITQKSQISSAFVDGVNLNEAQTILLTSFVSNAFSMNQKEVDSFAKQNGTFKNRLIDSINENCYEVLGDVLIEEDGDDYILNENYFKQILIQ